MCSVLRTIGLGTETSTCFIPLQAKKYSDKIPRHWKRTSVKINQYSHELLITSVQINQ